MERHAVKNAKTKAPIDFKRVPKEWDALMARHQLPPIHDDIDLRNATEYIDAMAGHDLTLDQDDYLDALSTLVVAYEERRHPFEIKVSGLAALRSLMEDQGMNASGLARLLDVHRSHASKILHGDRRLTADHSKVLSERFKVSADLFIR